MCMCVFVCVCVCVFVHMCMCVCVGGQNNSRGQVGQASRRGEKCCSLQLLIWTATYLLPSPGANMFQFTLVANDCRWKAVEREAERRTAQTKQRERERERKREKERKREIGRKRERGK